MVFAEKGSHVLVLLHHSSHNDAGQGGTPAGYTKARRSPIQKRLAAQPPKAPFPQPSSAAPGPQRSRP